MSNSETLADGDRLRGGLPPCAADALPRAICDDQAERWEAGERVPAEEYFRAFPEVAASPELQIRLIVGEWLLRWDAGSSPELASYQQRFPQHADELARRFRIHAAAAGPPPQPDLPAVPGYDIIGVIGSGGMGVVYRARHLALNRVVALKTAHLGARAGPDRLVRFRREAELLARLRHPHVVQVYESGAAGPMLYLTMEWVEGPNLADHCAGRPLPPREAARIAEALAGAVAHAHRYQIIHRDLKPSNVLMEGTAPKLTDFGLAKHLEVGDGMTATGAVMGTPAYMAPEQAAGRPDDVGPAADVYGLGAVLYEMLTGRPPFDGPTPLEVVRRVQSESPATITGVPRDVQTICLKCLEKEPRRRYASADALADDLRRYLAGKPIAARPVGAAEQAWRWCRRNPAVAGLLAAVFVTLTAGVLVASAFAVSANKAAELAKTRERQTREQVWRTQVNEASGVRRSGRRGRRFEAITTLETALRSAHELGELSEADRTRFRDEFTACLALIDFEVVVRTPPRDDQTWVSAFDRSGERYLRMSRAPGVAATLHRTADDAVLGELPDTQEGGVRFSPDGRWMIHVFGGDRRVARLWRLDGEKPVAVWEEPNSYWGDFSDDGRFLAVHFNGTVGVFDGATGRELRRLPGDMLAGQSFDPRKPRVAVRAADGVRFLDVETGADAGHLKLPATIDSVAWSPDGRHLAFGGGDMRLYLADLATGATRRVQTELHHHGLHPWFDPTGRWLIAANWGGEVRVVEAATGREVWKASSTFHDPHLAGGASGVEVTTQQSALVRLPAVVPVAGVLVEAADSPFSWPTHCAKRPWLAYQSPSAGTPVVDLATGRLLARLPPGHAPSHFEGDRALVTVRNGASLRWPIGGGRIGPPEPALPFNAFHRNAASDDGGVVAVANHNAGVLIWHRSGADHWRTTPPQQSVRACAVSPDGRWVVGCSHVQGGIRVYDSATGEMVHEVTPAGSTGTEFSPDGAYLAAGFWGSGGKLVRAGTWEVVREFRANKFAFSPDSKLVASGGDGGADTNVVTLYECATGREVARLEHADPGNLAPVGFSPNGTSLWTGYADQQVLLKWDLRAIRAGLKPRGLDWDWPGFAPAVELPPEPAWRVVGAELASDPDALQKSLEEDAKVALFRNPLDPAANARVGIALWRRNRFDLAYRYLDLSLKLRPGDLATLEARMQVALRLGYRVQAARDATVASARTWNRLPSLLVRAEANRQMGLHPLALADLDAAVNLRPDVSWLYERRARVREAMGDRKAADADIATARRLRGE